MKLKAIFFLITSATILHQARINATENEFKCETEGCYEVIKTFVKLLNEKINETDKVSFILGIHSSIVLKKFPARVAHI